MRDHIEINDFHASFDTRSDSDAIRLAIHGFNARLRRSGLNLLVEHLVPEIKVAVELEEPQGGAGVDVLVQATQWGLRPRVRARLTLSERINGAVVIELEAASRWSPLDWTMLRIMRDKIRQVSRRRTELSESGSEAFLVDVQRLIGDLIFERGVPVRWDARLSAIESTREDILLVFASVNEEAIPLGEPT